MKRIRKITAWLAAVLLVMAFAGCGGGEAEKPMKEVASSDGTVSIMLAEDWEVETDEGLIGGSSKNGNDGVVVMQFPRGTGVTDIADMKDAVEDSYDLSELAEADGVGMIPGLTNVEAYTCKMDLEGIKGEGYFIYGETDYAYYTFLYAANRINDNTMDYIRKVCESFKENAPEIENNSTVEISDTILWMNGTHAVLTAANGWDYTMFGSLPANDESMELQQELLDEWWDVTDRASADETLDWLLSEGHRMDFAENMDVLAEAGIGDVAAQERADFIYDNFEMTEEDAQWYAQFYNLYEEKGVDAISAWDYSRVMSVLANCYIAGYYTETEALDRSLEVASVIQTAYNSWDAFMDSYMTGYEYWAEESSDERREIYETIKAASDSPYSLDWNLTLEKSW